MLNENQLKHEQQPKETTNHAPTELISLTQNEMFNQRQPNFLPIISNNMTTIKLHPASKSQIVLLSHIQNRELAQLTLYHKRTSHISILKKIQF